ncbi:unnamed protein product [Cochlearia groenlandica]
MENKMVNPLFEHQPQEGKHVFVEQKAQGRACRLIVAFDKPMYEELKMGFQHPHTESHGENCDMNSRSMVGNGKKFDEVVAKLDELEARFCVISKESQRVVNTCERREVLQVNQDTNEFNQ